MARSVAAKFEMFYSVDFETVMAVAIIFTNPLGNHAMEKC